MVTLYLYRYSIDITFYEGIKMSVQAINPQVMNPPQIQKKQRYPWHAVASFMLPGTGQFIKGDKKKGKRDLGIDIGGIAVVVATQGFTAFKAFDLMAKAKAGSIAEEALMHQAEKLKTIAKIVGIVNIGIVGVMLINAIQSSVNAYRKQPPAAVEKK